MRGCSGGHSPSQQHPLVSALLALTLTAVALAVLLVHMPMVTATAGLARTASDPIVATLGGDVVHPALGLAVLVVVAVLNLYKPRGLSGYGRAPRPAQVLPHRGQHTLKPPARPDVPPDVPLPADRSPAGRRAGS